MTQLDRIGLASRSFCILAGLALAVLTQNAEAAQFALFLAMMGATVSWLGASASLSRAWVATGEALFTGSLIGLSFPDNPELLPCLLAAPLLAGLAGGVFPLMLAIAGESLALVVMTSDDLARQTLGERAESAFPWLIMSLGVGLLGAWLREIGLGPTSPAIPDPYEAARRLVSQLRTVARRLPNGLDAVSIAAQMQSEAASALSVTRSAVFIRTEGAMLSCLHDSEDSMTPMLVSDDPQAERCCIEMEPITSAHAGPTGAHSRVVLPLRVGARMVGVLVADLKDPPGADEVSAIMKTLDDSSLHLETALIFDEVRSIATVEERHRLAREIHDGVAQEIASLGYAVDDLLASAEDTEQAQLLASLRAKVTGLVSELRLSIFDLRSAVGITASLGTALSDYVQQVGSRSNMTVHLTLDEAATRLRSEVETELFRIAQEAITNARKHSSARNLWVDCRVEPPHATVIVCDDGKGRRSGRHDSYGLQIMQERAARIDADLQIRDNVVNGRPTGTLVAVRLGDPGTVNAKGVGSADEDASSRSPR